MANNRLIQQTEARQNRVQSFAFIIAASMAVLFSVGFTASGFWGVEQLCGVELDSRINPNKATAASLVRLPGIGIGRAGAIVAYRKNFSKKEGDKPAFETAADLQKVRGIGPKTVKNISRWLKFE